MSNSRKIKRNVKRNMGVVGAAALGTVATGTFVLPSATAFAAVTAFTNPSGAAPNVYAGLSNQPAANVQLTVDNTFNSGDTVTIPILPGGQPNGYGTGANGGDPTSAVTYSQLPTITVANVSGDNTNDVTPAVKASLATNPSDSGKDKNASIQDELVLTFTNNANNTGGTGGSSGDTFNITISGIQYNVGAAAATANLNSTGTTAGATLANSIPIDLTANYNAGGGNTTTTSNPVENAQIPAYLITDSPSGVARGSLNNAINDFALSEETPGIFTNSTTVPYQVQPISPAHVTGNDPSLGAGTFTGTATITATGVQVAAWTPTTGTANPTTDGTCGTTGASTVQAPAVNGEYLFCVISGTSKSPGSITVSKMTYTPPAGSFFSDQGVNDVQLTDSAGNTYSNADGSNGNAVGGQPEITVAGVQTIAGATADDTAAQAAQRFVGNNYSSGKLNNGNGGAVMLASDSEYQDALTAASLEYASMDYRSLGGNNSYNGCSYTYGKSGLSEAPGTQYCTPLLLNPYDTSDESSTAAARAIRQMGASTVYIIGGTFAISQNVANQLSQIQVGTSITGQPVYLQVIRIAGVTAEQTASDVAQYPAYRDAYLADTPGAYGLYNSGASESPSDTTGAGAGGYVRTAVLADADDFRDALSVSPLAAWEGLPVLLNAGGQGLDTNAANALTNLHIQQVVVVGGKYAVSDQAVADLIAAGYSVLRVAGGTFSQTSEEIAYYMLNGYGSQAQGSSTPSQQTGLAYQSCGSGVGEDNNCIGAAYSLAVGTSRGDAYQDALSSSQVLASDYNGPEPLLLNSDTSTISSGASDFLSKNGTGPAGGLVFYTQGTQQATHTQIEHVLYNTVFGGVLAQTPALIQTELKDIAAG